MSGMFGHGVIVSIRHGRLMLFNRSGMNPRACFRVARMVNFSTVAYQCRAVVSMAPLAPVSSRAGARPAAARFSRWLPGISTGALIAPFALLGSEYDDTLEEVYTQVTADDIFLKKSIFGAYWRESLADNQPLRNMVEEYISDEIIDAIAVAHNNGQRLLIGTTNFDAQRAVIWSMGTVANSKHPDAYDLFRNILVASAAIPILFPPTFIEVEAEGRSLRRNARRWRYHGANGLLRFYD